MGADTFLSLSLSFILSSVFPGGAVAPLGIYAS